jgi:hypothetical protein
VSPWKVAMTARNAPVQPDARLMQRLQWQLRQSAAPAAFVVAAEALAGALVGEGPLPAWADAMADTLVGSLLLVEANADCDEVSGVELARAALVLSVARPQVARACDQAVARFLARSGEGPGRCLTPAWGSSTAEDRVSRLFIASWLGDFDAVDEGAEALAGDGELAWSLALQRYARAQRLGTEGEIELAWGYIVEALRTFPDSTSSFTILLAVIRLGRAKRERGMARERVPMASSTSIRSRLAG